MTEAAQPLRQQLLDGTKALWSMATFVPAFVMAAGIIFLINPLLSPLEQPSTPVSPAFAIVFWIAILVGGFFLLRAQVWRPLHQLHARIDNPALFRSYAADCARKALPHAAMLAPAFAFLAFDFTYLVTLVQFGAVLLTLKLISNLRRQPIAESVTALTDRIAHTH